MKLLKWILLGKYQLENISKENFDRSYVEIHVKLMNEMNEAVVLDRNKLQIENSVLLCKIILQTKL